MQYSDQSVTRYLAIALLAVVATQLAYMALSGTGFNSALLWTLEAVLFLGIAVFGFSALVRFGGAPLWAVIAIGGLLNIIQAGMGIAMFGPLKEADAVLAPALQAVQAGAFFFYFAGKLAFGYGAIWLGLGHLRDGSAGKGKRTVGLLCLLSGIAAAAINIIAIADGMSWVFMAGASGTLATFLLGVGLLIGVKSVKV